MMTFFHGDFLTLGGKGEKFSSIIDVFIVPKFLNMYEIIYVSHYFCHVSKEDLYFFIC